MNNKIVNYKITWDELESKIPESLKPLLQGVYDDIQHNKPNVIPRLQKLIEKYPSNVQLKNYLSAAYTLKGNHKKARQVNDMILKQNPDYLFAKINKASQFYDEGEYEKMQEILGKGFDLKVLYPDRDVFHITEVMSIQEMAVRYYSAIGELDQAQKRLEIMEELDEDSAQYSRSTEIYIMATMREASKRLESERRKRITPRNQFHLKKKKFKLPEFNIPITSDLYDYEFDIPEELPQELFDQDRNQVIEDLENVLKDSYYNYPRHGRDEEESFAPIHAFFLLGELEAEESLPLVLEMMQQDEEYMEDVFGDLFTEAGWIPLVKIGKNKLDALLEYLKLPGTFTFFKSGASDALEQIWFHYPAKRPEVERLFGELLEFLVHTPPKENVVDTMFNDLLISNLLNLRLKQFLPQIKMLFDKGYASDSMRGTFDEVKSEMQSNIPSSQGKRALKTMKKVYESFVRLTEPLSRIDDRPAPKNQPVVRTSKKIGRNDPCPCGSGKKYKKCCLH